MKIDCRQVTQLVALGFSLNMGVADIALAQAQPVNETDYCYGSLCYATLHEAEAAMRNANPTYGEFLRPRNPFAIPKPGALHDVSLVYYVPDQSPANLNNGVFAPDFTSNPAPQFCAAAPDPIFNTWCQNEGELIQGIIASYQTVHGPSATVVADEPTGSYFEEFSIVSPAGGLKGHLSLTHENNMALQRMLTGRIYNSQGAPRGGFQHRLFQHRSFECPVGFAAKNGQNPKYNPATNNPVYWDKLCYSAFETAIVAKLRAQCSDNDGKNPCYPATGDKARFETDFQFAGRPFVRSYHSLRQAGQRPELAPGWVHTYSDRVIGAPSSSRLTHVSDNGYLGVFNRVRKTARYVSPEDAKRVIDVVVESGKNVFRLGDEGDLVRYYNDAGRLLRVESLTSYSKISFVYEGERLVSANDHTGLKLVFEYADSQLESLLLPDGNRVYYSYDSNRNLESVQYADGTQRTYHYNEAGFSDSNDPHALTGISDNGQRYLTFGYDLKNRVRLSQAHTPSGFVEKTTLSYSGDNQVTVTGPQGDTRQYTLSSASGFRRVTAIAAADGTLSNTFNGALLFESRDKLLNVTRREYAPDNAYVSARYDAYGTSVERKTVTARDAAYRLTSRQVQAKVGSGYVTQQQQSLTYNSRSQVLTRTTTDPATGQSRTTTNSYCEQADVTADACPFVGLLKSVDGSRTDVADTSTYAYRMDDHPGCAAAPTTCEYRKGNLWKITNALNQVTEFIAYDGAGRLLRQKDANGVITDLVYHPRGWLISRTVRANADGSPDPALDARTRLEYEPYGDIKRVIQPDDSGLEYCRDQAHRITAVVSTTFAQASRCNGSAPVASSEAIVYTLDAAGNRIREEVRDSTGAIKRLLARQYNTLNQLRGLVNAPYAAQADLDAPAVKKTSYTYDANGNQDLTTDPLARVADNDYDPLNRLIRSIQDKDTAAATGEVAATVSYEYDARDNLRKVTDPKGLITQYVYDGLNNQTQLISPDTGTTTYTYDAAGNRLTQTDARGVLSQYSYDALGRLSTIQYPSDSAKNVGFTYDTVQPGCAGDETAAVGRLVRIDDATGSTRLCYDRRGNVRRKLQESGGELLVVEYRYNLANRLVGMTYPSGLVVSYGRDALGRVSSVGLSRGGFTLPLVDALSYLPFGPVAQIQFGNGQALTKAWDQNYWPDAIGGGVLDYDFSTNDVGNIVTVASTSEGTQHLNYDRLDRLQEVRDSNLALIEAYTYDATGNRLSQQLGTQAATSYSYPSTSHRLSAVGAAARGYDAVGNTLTGVPGYEADSASYDARNRLVQVGSPSAQLLANYNGRGERVLASQGTPAPALPTTSAAWTTSAGVRGYLYDESGQVLSTLIAGNPLRYEEIVWIDNIPVGRVLSSTSAVLEVHAIHSDHLNTPRALANAQAQGGQAAGTVVWRWKLNSASATGSNAF